MKTFKFFQILLLIILLSSCSAVRYGKNSKIKILCDSTNVGKVDITAYGRKSIKEYSNVSFPFKLKVNHKNLPIRVNIESDNYIYDDIYIKQRNCKGYLFDYIFSRVFAGLTVGIGALYLPMFGNEYIPDAKKYYAIPQPITQENAFKNIYQKRPEWKLSVLKDEIYSLNKLGSDQRPYDNYYKGSFIYSDEYKLAKGKIKQLQEYDDLGEYYYLRGVSNYRLEKYKSAIKDFKKALNYDDVKLFKDDISSFMYAAQDKRREEVQQRRNALAGIAVGLINTTIQTTNTLLNARYNNYSMYNVVSLSSDNDSFLRQIQQQGSAIAQQTLIQTEQQDLAEYRMFADAWRNSTGKEISRAEYWAMKGAAIQQLQSEGYDPFAYTKSDNDLDVEVEDYFDNNKKDITKKEEKMVAPQKSEDINKDIKDNNKTKQTYDEQNNEKKLNNDSPSDDYVFDRYIDLYSRNGDNSRISIRHVQLVHKGVTKYVKVGSIYYLVGYSNWLRFNRSIIYAHNSLYFND